MILRRLYTAKWNKWRIYLLISLLIYLTLKYLRCRDVEHVPERLRKYLRFEKNYSCSSSLELQALYEQVERLNREREVLNWKAFGPVHSDTPVLAVRAGRRPQRLQLLVLSLAQVHDIASAIVVFSHSFYDESVDRLIRDISFCMVLQIYFPYSLQLYPNVFPGVDPSESCANATGEERDPCYERDARRAELKHHWWWMAHVLFDELAWAQAHRGMVVFLEEDDYVLPDFMHMLRFARASLAYVPEVQVLAFGRPLARDLDYDKLTVDSWRPPYDRGLTFNRTTWRYIKKLAYHFCVHDDTSWSYSLLHAFEQSRQRRAIMAACMAPRVISTGVFDSGPRALEHIHSIIRSEELFPRRTEAVLVFGSGGRAARGRGRGGAARGGGGWGDARDVLLCLDPLYATDPLRYYTTSPGALTTT